MRVGRPRVGVVDAVEQMPERRRRGRPQPERAVHVHPGAALVGERRSHSANGSNAPECRLPACSADAATGAGRHGGQRLGERVRPDPALVVGGDDGRLAEAEVAQREVDRAVPLGADQHVHPRRTGQPVAVARPSRPRPARAAARRQAGEVGHRGAGDEPDVGCPAAARAGRAASRPAPPRRGRRRGWRSRIPVFWSQALISQSAASAAGSVPPITQPKNRPDGIAMQARLDPPASRSTTSAGSVPASGSGPPNTARSPSAVARGGTGRSASEPSQRSAWACAAANAVS